MAIDVVMPRLTDSMQEGTVLAWLKSVGDPVRQGEPLVEIETDKTALRYEADSDGVLLSITVGEGETVPIGTTIGCIGSHGEEPAAPPHGRQAPGEPDPPLEAATPAAASGERADAGRRRAGAAVPRGRGGLPPTSPLARRLAAEHAVDLTTLAGTGRGGTITRRDVEWAVAAAGGSARSAPVGAAAVSAPAPATPVTADAPAADGAETEVVALTRLQQTVAQRMTEAKATVPHFAIDMTVDVGEALELRARLRASAAEGDAAPSLNDFVLRAVATALRRHPEVNAAWNDGTVLRHSRAHVGFAVASSGTLLVPVVHNADRLSVRQIAAATAHLAERARSGALEPSEASGGTFTVTNLGMYGVERFVPIINPPQAGILAVGASRKAVEPDEEGGVTVRDVLTLTLVSDHRVLYGADAASFLSTVRTLLEDPYGLVA